MSEDSEDEELIWAFVSECLGVGGFLLVRKWAGIKWRWVVKEGVLHNELIWVGCDSGSQPPGVMEVGRRMRVGFPEDREGSEKVLGVLSVANPKFGEKLLALVEDGVRLANEEPHLFVDKVSDGMRRWL